MMACVMLISISIVARTKVRDDDGRDSRGVFVLDTACRDDLRQTLLTPLSTTMSEPVMNEALVRGEEEGRVGELFGCSCESGSQAALLHNATVQRHGMLPWSSRLGSIPSLRSLFDRDDMGAVRSAPPRPHPRRSRAK
jgi:hypothetical protein